MKISLDFDGVLSHTMQLWCVRYNQIMKPQQLLTISDIKDWAFFENLGMSIDKAFEIFDWCWSNSNLLQPLEQDQNLATDRLFELGDVDIVTSVRPKHQESIFNWLKQHRIRYSNLIFKESKHELDYDIYIDDSPVNAINIAKVRQICLLYDQLWNRKLRGRNIIRVFSLKHAAYVIENKLVNKF